MDQTKLELRQFSLESARIEHGELWDAWKVVEAKAQPLAAISGVFLAGVISYLGVLPSTAGTWERVLLIVIAALLVVSIVISLLALQVVRVTSPHIGEAAITEVDEIIKAAQPPERLEDRQVDLIRDAAKRWTKASESVSTALDVKIRRLKWSLRVLVVAAVVAVVLAGVAAFRPVDACKVADKSTPVNSNHQDGGKQSE